MSVGESQSLGETLRRQGIYLLEARVGRTAVIDRIFAKNGYGDVLPIFRYDRHNLFYFIKNNSICVPVAGYSACRVSG